jgi:hypothetical protein
MKIEVEQITINNEKGKEQQVKVLKTWPLGFFLSSAELRSFLGEWARERVIEQRDKPVPVWVLEVFHVFFNGLYELYIMSSLARHGIITLDDPQDIEEFFTYMRDEFPLGEFFSNVQSETVEAIIYLELDNGFRVLNSWLVVDLWAKLEDLVYNLLAGWLTEAPSAMQTDSGKKILSGTCEITDPYERRLSIIDKLKDPKLRAGRRALHFENLLEPFGLSGHVDKTTEDDLLEMKHVRNAIAHCNGVADRKLLEKCKSIDVQPGEPIAIKPEALTRYNRAVITYVNELLKRILSYFLVQQEHGDGLHEIQMKVLNARSPC